MADEFEFIISALDLHVINTVRKIRVSKKISQIDLAHRMEMTDAVIGKVENVRQRAKYSIRHLNLLAKALDCSPRDLLPEEPLEHDMIKVKVRVIKQPRSARSEPNFEIISQEPVEKTKKGRRIKTGN